MSEYVTISRIIRCARCGQDHSNLIAKQMGIPMAPPEAQGIKWTHWATCPTNGDPIMIVVVKTEEVTDVEA